MFGLHVQSNQKMHDLYATLHIFQMALPDAFLGSIESNFFHNIIGKIKISKILRKKFDYILPKKASSNAI